MTFLTSLDILDTGYLTKSKSGTILSNANRVNNGNALRLKGVSFVVNSSASLDTSTHLTKTSEIQIPFISALPTTFTISIFLDERNTDTNNQFSIADMSYIYELYRLPRTQGVKAIYYPVTVAATGDTRGRDKQLVYLLGSQDSGSVTQTGISLSAWNGSAEATGLDLTDVKYISARFESVQMTQQTSSAVRINLEGVFTI